MTQPRFGNEVAMTFALYQSSRECRSDCTKIFVIVTLVIASFYNFFVKFFLETITNYTAF